MSETENEGYTVSFKTDEGYAAALVVVRGADAKALKKNLKAFDDDLMDLVVKTRADLLAINRVKGMADEPKSESKGSPKQESSGGEDKFCEHGKREYKTGTSSRGKWEGWMCPRPKNASDKCDPVWG